MTRIVVQARDLDHNRIDGTRVYLKQLLDRFGALQKEVSFDIYHKDAFNKELTPKVFPNYSFFTLPGRFVWMQTSFALAMLRKKPEKVFLPLQAAPLFFPSKTELTVTIHDLAFRFYPSTFPWWTRWKLRIFLRILLWRAKKIICVSHATKRDLLHFFPHLLEKRIRVVHHGFDDSFFNTKSDPEATERLLKVYGAVSGKYLLYVGALQPRKNINRIIEAFEKVKKEYPDYKLVLAGEPAWLAETILNRVASSPYAEDIILTGGISFESVRALYQRASLFLFPSLYEGFGLPILEAFASGVPVLVSENSSLREVAGDGAWYCDAFSADDIAKQIQCVLGNENLRTKLMQRSQEQLRKFSWDKAAEETLDFILEKG
jgi:glycosyltransferase involved in cell wall biosynthesis